MNSTMIKKTRFFPIWEEEKEINWLEDMSKQGWHLVKKGYLSYWFESGDKKEYIYRYDFKLPAEKDYAEYRQIFEDSGWVLVGEFANWHYFKCEKGRGAEDIYTDKDSKMARLKRIFAVMVILAVINLVIILNNVFLLNMTDGGLKSVPAYMFIIWGISLLVITLLVYAAVRIFIRMKKLKKSINE